MASWRVLWLLVALLLVLLPAQAVAQTSVGMGGLLRWRSGADLENTVVRLRANGVKWGREDFAWSRVEISPGVYDWSHLDQMMSAAARNDMRIIAIPNKPPHWHQVAGEQHTPPTSGEALVGYVRFVKAAINRYGPEGSFWAMHPELPKKAVVY